MCKYKVAIENIEHLIKSCGFNAYSKDLELIKELFSSYKEQKDNARENSIKMLEKTEFYGDDYYKMEDWVTDVIKGENKTIPLNERMCLDYVLRAEVKDIAFCNDIEIDDEQVEEILDELHHHFSEDVLNRDFIYDEVQYFINKKQGKKNIERLTYLLEKQKVCPLDKEESYELYELLN